MISPIILISVPVITIISLATAYFFAPDIDPALTLLYPDIPVRRIWPMVFDENRDELSPYELRCFLSNVHRTELGHFTCNVKYPILAINSFDDVALFTKNYVGACGKSINVNPEGQFSFSWPTTYHNDKNSVHVFSFTGIREILTEGDLTEEDQIVVDWFNSWAKDNPWWTYLFVSPDDPGNSDGSPSCIKIMYFTHQVYTPEPGGVGCDGLVYDTTRLRAQYPEPVMYSTADVLNQPPFTVSKEGLFPRLCLIELLKSAIPDYHIGVIHSYSTFYTTLVHPVNNLPPQDFISVHLEGAGSYKDFNPGPLSSSAGNPADSISSVFPKILIFVACATTLALCTYLGYNYIG